VKALLVVDLQNDFVPGGSLSVPEGDQIIPTINKLMKMDFDLIVASKDWHPPKHGSFAETHTKTVGDHIDYGGVDQILWPVHCVQNSYGADFVSTFNSEHVDLIIYKGTEMTIDSYSAFFDNNHQHSTGLEQLLCQNGITDLYIVGLATDYCVKFSVLDAIHLGFRTYVIEDACRGVNLKNDDSRNALKEMRKAGAVIINSKSLFDAKGKGVVH